jgi:hypothetical protein
MDQTKNTGLLGGLLGDSTVNFTVAIDDKSILHFAIALLIVFVIAILLWGIARKNS